MGTKTETIKQKTQRYWYNDGIPEIVIGNVLLTMGIYYGLVQLILGEVNGIALWLGGFITLVLCGLERVVITRLKERITYPRTGYIGYRQVRGWPLTILIVCSFIVGMMLGLWSMINRDNVVLELIVKSPLTWGLWSGMVFLVIWYSNGIQRWLWYAGCAVLTGLILTALRLPSGVAWSLFLLSTGVYTFAVGMKVFRQYILNNPPLHEEVA